MAETNSGRWKSEHWFVSPWNYEEEVSRRFQPPKQVRIHDIALPDGEQQAGMIFTKDDKMRIAEKLAEAGVHRIEAGMPAVSSNDEEAIREIVMGKKSGLNNIEIWAKRLGIELSNEEAMEALMVVKRKSYDLKRVLSEK